MEIVDAVVCALCACRSVICNVSLGEEVDDVGGRVNDRCTDDANGVGNVGTTNIGLEEGLVHRTFVDEVTRLRVQGPDDVL